MSRCIWIGVIVGLSVVVIIVLGLALGLTLGKNHFKSTFFGRCEKFEGANCQELWEAFSEAYVGKNPCNVSMEAYDSLIQKAPIDPMYSRSALFWSKTKYFLLDYKTHTNTMSLEDTLLGSLVDDETWCGKEGSKETFTSGCPGWDGCVNNPVHSFWRRASAAFADAARDDATALLNGDSDDPFNPTSIFRSIELKRLKYPTIMSMTVELVSHNPGDKCLKPFLEDLKKELDKGIHYSCFELSNGHKCLASILVYLLLMGQLLL